MADLDLVSNRGIVDKRVGRGVDKANNNNWAETANMNDIKAIRARLAALSAGSYTSARMDTMTRNDLIYALRVASSDVASF